MVVISFFQDFFNQLGLLLGFVTKPLREINPDITLEPFADLSIMALLSSGLVATLSVLLAIHLIRLFIGG